MASNLTKMDTDAPSHKRGHFRAYDLHGTVIWEKEDFVIGVDNIPGGLSYGMSACLIEDTKGVELHRWNPRGVLPRVQ